MKRNFYLQHPLMAMYDPRMKQLIEEEGLRGLGAYWLIIEKLEVLPEPRAREEYLRPHCDKKKIILSYLMKIIREYGLFELEEDGYFMPKELNPLRKKDEKTGKTEEGKHVSDAKNDEKQPKTQKGNTGKQAKKTDKKLQYNNLPKTTGVNKEHIKDLITTTATAKEEENAAAADEAPLQPSDVGGVPPSTPNEAQTACECNDDDDNNDDGNNNGSNNDGNNNGSNNDGNNNDDSSQTPPPKPPVESWHKMVDNLVCESSWLDIACMKSGYGCLLKRHIRQAVKIFEQHIEAYGKGDRLLEMSDVQGYFVNYVSAGSRTSRTLHEVLCTLDTKLQATAPPTPYRHELLVNGKRTYLGCPIPDDAPPRPDNTAFWNETARSWTSQKLPPSSKRPKQKPG